MKKLYRMRFLPLLSLSLVIMMAVPAKTMAASAIERVPLGTTESFAILAGETVTNTGTTIINGDAGNNVGVYPGSAFVDTGVTMIGGTVYLSDGGGVASGAKADLQIAYNNAASRIPTITYDASDNQLGGKTLTSGVYAFGHATTANLIGTLTLDAQGDPNAVFIFQASSDLVMASNSVVKLVNGARYCRIFWQVSSSATLKTNSVFVGHIFAQTSVWAQTGASVQGQLLALNGEVTLDSNTIMNGLCAATQTATLTVIKQVINDDGGTALASDFILHVKTSGSDVAAAFGNASGTTYTLAADTTYVVSEDPADGYSVSYSGDGDSSGTITLASGDNKTVTVTNNDILVVSSQNESKSVSDNPSTGDTLMNIAAILLGLIAASSMIVYIIRKKNNSL